MGKKKDYIKAAKGSLPKPRGEVGLGIKQDAQLAVAKDLEQSTVTKEVDTQCQHIQTNLEIARRVAQAIERTAQHSVKEQCVSESY